MDLKLEVYAILNVEYVQVLQVVAMGVRRDRT